MRIEYCRRKPVRVPSTLEISPQRLPLGFGNFLLRVRLGIKVQDFFVPFNGKFQGRSHNAHVPPPPPRVCQFQTPLHITILSICVSNHFGKSGQWFMPITIEPSKPRMCHNKRFLNCWNKDCAFSLDYITDLLRNLGVGHYQTMFDDKSG